MLKNIFVDDSKIIYTMDQVAKYCTYLFNKPCIKTTNQAETFAAKIQI